MAYLSKHLVSSGYGPRAGGMHWGVDYATPIGVPIPAVSTGIVAYSAWGPGLNGTRELIIVVQSDGFYIVYGHMSENWVRVGQKVGTSQIIGKSGASGFVTGPHLHVQEHTGKLGANIYNNPVRDITPRLRAYGGEEVTNQEYAENVVRLLADVIEGNPHYDTKHPEAFRGHVNRILNAKEPLEDRRVGHDFMNNYKKKNQRPPGDQHTSIDSALIDIEKASDLLIRAESTLARA